MLKWPMQGTTIVKEIVASRSSREGDTHPVESIDTLNRISVFQTLTLDELKNLEMDKFEDILGPYYHNFTELCETIKKRTDIVSIKYKIKEESVIFILKKIDGTEEEF